MLDVLQPVHEALAGGKTAAQIADVADAAADATVPMKALRGRASFLGDRSIGHMDAGARSTALLVRTLGQAIGTKLVMTVGGASGPLFGTLFMALGKEIATDPDRASLTAAFGKAIEAVAARGKSQPGQKTMLDVLQPVYEALAQGKTATEIANAADKAAEATVPMKALRGRASFLGERSIGHMDAGARSTALLVRAVAEAIEGI